MTDPDWKYVRLLETEAFRRRQGPPPRPEPNPPRVEKRVTMTTGSHHMQAYWVAGEFGNQQFSVPFTYLFEEERWVPRNDVFHAAAGHPSSATGLRTATASVAMPPPDSRNRIHAAMC